MSKTPATDPIALFVGRVPSMRSRAWRDAIAHSLLALLFVVPCVGACQAAARDDYAVVGQADCFIRYEQASGEVVELPANNLGDAWVGSHVRPLLELSESQCREKGIHGFVVEMLGCQVIDANREVIGLVGGSPGTTGLPILVSLDPVPDVLQSLRRLSIAIADQGRTSTLDILSTPTLLTASQRQDRVLLSSSLGTGGHPIVGVIYATLGTYSVARIVNPLGPSQLQAGYSSMIVSRGQPLSTVFDGGIRWFNLYEYGDIVGHTVFSDGIDIVLSLSETPSLLELSIHTSGQDGQGQTKSVKVSADQAHWQEWTSRAASSLVSWVDLGRYVDATIVIDGKESSFTLGNNQESTAQRAVQQMIGEELKALDASSPPRSIALRLETDVLDTQ